MHPLQLNAKLGIALGIVGLRIANKWVGNDLTFKLTFEQFEIWRKRLLLLGSLEDISELLYCGCLKDFPSLCEQ